MTAGRGMRRSIVWNGCTSHPEPQATRNSFGLACGGCRLACGMAAVALSLIFYAGSVFAQTDPSSARPAAPRQPADKRQPQLVYYPWTKVCDKDSQDANGGQVCLIIQEARLDTGQFIASAVVIEPQGKPENILRVTVPLGVQLQPGSRVIIDEGTPVQRPYSICLEIGCIAEYVVDAAKMSELKKGQTLAIQAINASGRPISLPMPLADFVKAIDGPPTHPQVLEERRKKLESEVRMREQARKKLSGQPAATAPAASAPGK
jgi:invasion protein IalB